MSGYVSDLLKFLKEGKEKEKCFRGEKTIEKRAKNIISFLPEKDHGDRMLMEKVREILGQTDLWVIRVNTSKYTKRYKDRKYTYTRKRIELPRDFDDDVAVVFTRKKYKQLLQKLAELAGLTVVPEKVKEILEEES